MRVLSGALIWLQSLCRVVVSVTFLGARLVQVAAFVAENAKFLSMSAPARDLEGRFVSRFGNFSTRFGVRVMELRIRRNSPALRIDRYFEEEKVLT